MTSDHYLRFDTPEAMLDALRPLGMTYTDDEGTEHASQGSHQFALWVVGLIEGVEGFHVNLRVIDPELDVSSLAEYEVSPRNPVCIWA
jgi:hypothetical protein